MGSFLFIKDGEIFRWTALPWLRTTGHLAWLYCRKEKHKTRGSAAGTGPPLPLSHRKVCLENPWCPSIPEIQTQIWTYQWRNKETAYDLGFWVLELSISWMFIGAVYRSLLFSPRRLWAPGEVTGPPTRQRKLPVSWEVEFRSSNSLGDVVGRGCLS